MWNGVQCSSFVVLCRSVSLRDFNNSYLGNESRRFVQVGNALADVGAMTLLLGALQDTKEVLEQPLNSCMPVSAPMRGTLVPPTQENDNLPRLLRRSIFEAFASCVVILMAPAL